MATTKAATAAAEVPHLAVKRVPIDSIHQDPANARSHGPENMAAIEASLRRFGQAEPLVVQAGTGRVIGGNGRLAAMKKLGWTDCDIVELDIDDLQATALGIALNRSSELAFWNEPALAKILEELRAEDALDGVGYSPADIDALLEELKGDVDPKEIDDPGPSPPTDKPVTRLQDLWLLGEHRLLCGDSTKPGDITRLMAGEKAALLSTDPPYCVEYTGDVRPQDSGKDWSKVYREIDIKDLGEFLRAMFGAVLPHLEADAAIYVWHAHLQYPVIDRVFEEFGILRHQPIIWKKPSSTFTYSYYRWAHEPCLFGWRQGHKPPHYLENGMTSVWEVDWEGKQRITSFHPTSKPTKLFEIPMEQHTKTGAIVLEPFCGSGSQIIAAEKLGRKCRAMEISPVFIDGTILRWQQATGKEARLEGGGTFAEVKAERAGEVTA
jgi:DNA modification methylase